MIGRVTNLNRKASHPEVEVLTKDFLTVGIKVSKMFCDWIRAGVGASPIDWKSQDLIVADQIAAESHPSVRAKVTRAL